MRRLLFIIFFLSASFFGVYSAESIVTSYSASDCMGTASPYPNVKAAASYPDSLTPVFINHIGRHGSRFPASAKSINRLTDALQRASSEKTITPRGKSLMRLAKRVTAVTAGRWGALDSLGIAEECGIAARMADAFPNLIENGRVVAYSSYAPRCIMSMYSFTHQLARLNNRIEINTSSGRQYSGLLRPFDTDKEYLAYRESSDWSELLAGYRKNIVPLGPIKDALGNADIYGYDELCQLALDEYSLVAGATAAGVAVKYSDFFTLEEYNRLWEAADMRHYLLYAANTLSTIPADMASPLLMDLINTTDSAANAVGRYPSIILRFAHAETLMPLISLLRLKGGYYMTNYFETVPQHWKDFSTVPMGANLQFILFKSKRGNYYLRLDLNEKPIPLMPGSEDIYIPWNKAKEYMGRCIPIFYQP